MKMANQETILLGPLGRIRAMASLAALLLIVVVLPSRLSAQAESAAPAGAQSVPRIAVGEISGTPGASLMVPLYYTPDPKVPLRSVAVEIEFVSNNLEFQKVAKGLAADSSGAEVTGTVTKGTPDDKGVTRSKLLVTTKLADANSQKGLDEGLLAYLLFQISLQAKPFAIKLNPTVVAAEDLRAQKVAKVAADPGVVAVEALDVMPEATCFFFTH
jgi:hypothetical protein